MIPINSAEYTEAVQLAVRDHTGLVVAAISVSAPVQRMTKKNTQTLSGAHIAE